MILTSKHFVEQNTKHLSDIVQDFKLEPKLAIIVAKDYSKASSKYVKNKHNLANKIGISIQQHDLEWKDVDVHKFKQELEDLIDKLNKDDSVHGIIVQLPIPYVDENWVAGLIVAHKDVDGFSPYNLGMLMRGEQIHTSCTPMGIMSFLEGNHIEIEGKVVCIVGRSNIVGKPLINLMINSGATVICCNSKTLNLCSMTKQADIVITAIGKPKHFTRKHFSKKAVVVDVGINFDENGKMCGDVDFDNVFEHVSAITPVPGGVGPLTVLSLMENCVKACYMEKL